jgi:hypothetical protein
MNSCSVFVGCSFTAGSGFEKEKQDHRLWVNILKNHNRHLIGTELINLGLPGRSNTEIFVNSIDALHKHKPKFMFVQWTSYPRYSILLSTETYNSEQIFLPSVECSDWKFSDSSYSSSYLNNIKNRFLSLHHPHQGIVEIVKYSNLLINTASATNTSIFFINGLCPWDQNYFEIVENVLPSSYTPYTQSIINCESRSDQDAIQIYKKLHQDYKYAGSIDQQHWLNLYCSMKSMKVDFNNDSLHPGIQTNQLYFEFFNQAINNLLGS